MVTGTSLLIGVLGELERSDLKWNEMKWNAWNEKNTQHVMNEWTNDWMHGWMDGWMQDGWMDEKIDENGWK